MNKNPFNIQDENWDSVCDFTQNCCNVGNFILPALNSGLLSEVQQIRSEYALLHSQIPDHDYIFDIDNPDLNVNQYTTILSDLKHSHHILVVEPSQTLEQVLKANRLYSKFVRFAENYVIPLNLEVWLPNSVSYCLSDYGFAEFFQAATSYQLRI